MESSAVVIKKYGNRRRLYDTRELGIRLATASGQVPVSWPCGRQNMNEPFLNGLLFHELVHVEQYRQLGIPRFAELYVCGFLNGGTYEAIHYGVGRWIVEGSSRVSCDGLDPDSRR